MKKTKLESALFYYDDYLKLIGNFSLSQQLTLKDLGETPEDKAVIQKCYRDIKREKFTGNVIDYLCYLSYQKIVKIFDHEAIFPSINLKENKGVKVITFSTSEEVYKYITDCRIQFEKKKHNINDLLMVEDIIFAEKMISFLLICHNNETHSKNMIRLFQRNPWLLIESEYNIKIQIPSIDFATQTLNYFTLMMCLNCYEMLKEKLVKKEHKDNLWTYLMPRFVEMIIAKMYHSSQDKNMTKLIKNIEFVTFKDN